ncbi:hypothetical protein BaRGS_00007993, partial [Batillaria attramentaria]
GMRIVIFVAVAALLRSSARSSRHHRNVDMGPRPCNRYMSDGCSHLDGGILTPACDRHDICYNCGAHYGVSRHECDQAFYSDMTRQCSRLPTFSPRRWTCNRRRSVFFTAVRWFGGSSYKDPSTNHHCLESWVPSCLPPWQSP